MFLAGMNVSGYDVRESPSKTVELLKDTPIKWLRVHALPNRSLEEKGSSGYSYIEGIEQLCKNGYNIVAPIEVGYSLNVGNVSLVDLDTFIENSYHESFKASKKITEVAQRTKRDIIFCIENEIDVKSWILQSLPGIGWRSQFETWAKQATDFNLKYKRLNNILKGVLDADPYAKTLANVVAEDSRILINYFQTPVMQQSDLLQSCDVKIENIFDEAIDWKFELKYINDNLNVDYIGLDTYANWILKYPVYGQETGAKINEATKLTNKPILNAEFGYTTFRNIIENTFFPLMGRPNASMMQLEFFKNTLTSIESSSSIGTFPWVLFTHTDLPANPRQEAYFGLIKINKGDIMKVEPSFTYYIEWLKNISSKDPHPAIRH
jgi:hypothetical protein